MYLCRFNHIFFSSIVTQYKIERFKKSVDEQANFNQVEKGEEIQERNINFNYHKNTIRVVLILCFVLLLSFIFFLRSVNTAVKSKNLYIQYLRLTSVLMLIHHICIPATFIVRNENLYIFSKCQILKIIKFPPKF